MYRLFFLAFLFMASLVACGKKGPLFLPETKTDAIKTAAEKDKTVQTGADVESKSIVETETKKNKPEKDKSESSVPEKSIPEQPANQL